MARFKNIIFICLLIFLFVEVLIIFPQYLEKIEADPRAEEKVQSHSAAEQKMQGVHLFITSKGARDGELFANTAEAFESKNSMELQEVKVQLYNQDRIEFVVTGKAGSMNTKSNDMKIYGNVKVVSTNGYHFESQEILYKSQDREIQSPGPVKMLGPRDQQGDGMILHGSKMTVFVDTSKMVVKEDIRAVKKLNSTKKIDLSSDEVEMSGRHREVSFLGHVNINYSTAKIESKAATFYYSQEKDRFKSILFSGGVRVSDEDKYAMSDEMNLDADLNKFTFTGKPRVYQNNDELTGEQIVFLEGGKKVKVEKIKARVENKKK